MTEADADPFQGPSPWLRGSTRRALLEAPLRGARLRLDAEGGLSRSSPSSPVSCARSSARERASIRTRSSRSPGNWRADPTWRRTRICRASATSLRAIRRDPVHRKDRVWDAEGRGFAHRASASRLRLPEPRDHLHGRGRHVRRLAYDPSRFDFGGLAPPTQTDLDFSGFRVLYRDRAPRTHAMSRASGRVLLPRPAKGQVPGLLARALDLAAGRRARRGIPAVPRLLDRAAECARRRASWRTRSSIRESVCGAYRFTIRPRDITHHRRREHDLSAQRPRSCRAMAASPACFLRAASHRIDDDVRPEVHDANGLQLHNGQDEWIWRPLHNPETLQISAFIDRTQGLRASAARARLLGLPGRRAEASSGALARGSSRSAIGAEGAVQLLEIPTNAEINDEHPDLLAPEGADRGRARRRRFRLSPVLGLDAARAADLADRPDHRASAGARPDGAASSSNSSPATFQPSRPRSPSIKRGGEPSERQRFQDLELTPSSGTQDVRVASTSTRAARRLRDCDLAFLEQAAKPLSETWLYRWTSRGLGLARGGVAPSAARGLAPSCLPRSAAGHAGAVASTRFGPRAGAQAGSRPDRTPPVLARAVRVRRRRSRSPAYGALRDVQGRVGRRHHAARMGAGRAVRRQLLLDRARLHERASSASSGCCSRPSLPPSAPRLSARGATAVVMPIYNEATARGFAAHAGDLRGRRRRTGSGADFDFFFLSDTTDPDVWIAEERAFLAMRARLAAGAHLLPPPAARTSSRKAGNIADFVTRWGGALPAHGRARRRQPDDRRVRSSRSPPRWRPTPTPASSRRLPLIINRNTLFARLQQFAARIYGPVIAAGLSVWMGRDGNYWGHNAIIRTRAFADALRPAGPAGQAAVRRPHPQPRFRRGGADAPRRLGRLHAARPRRLLRGEPALAHRSRGARPALVPGQSAARARHRRARASRWRRGSISPPASWAISPRRSGWRSCWSASCWCCSRTTSGPNISPSEFSLFPAWPRFDYERALQLFELTIGILLAPKFLGLLLALIDGRRRAAAPAARSRSSPRRSSRSSSRPLLAPIMMLIQSGSVAQILSGRDTGWNPQRRDDGSIPFSEHRAPPSRAHGARRHHAVRGSLISPSLVVWMSPTIVGLSSCHSALLGERKLDARPRRCGASGCCARRRRLPPPDRDARQCAAAELAPTAIDDDGRAPGAGRTRRCGPRTNRSSPRRRAAPARRRRVETAVAAAKLNDAETLEDARAWLKAASASRPRRPGADRPAGRAAERAARGAPGRAPVDMKGVRPPRPR